MENFRKSIWAYWFFTAVLLALGLSVWPEAIQLVILLNAIQVVHVLYATRSFTAFPSQVRLVYFAMLVVGSVSPFGFLHWIQLAGTWAMVLFGYCPLARLLSLMPGNRKVPFTLSLLKTTLFTKPVKGSILQAQTAH